MSSLVLKVICRADIETCAQMFEGDCDAQLPMRRQVQHQVNRETIHAKMTAVMSAAAFQSYISWSH